MITFKAIPDQPGMVRVKVGNKKPVDIYWQSASTLIPDIYRANVDAHRYEQEAKEAAMNKRDPWNK